MHKNIVAFVYGPILVPQPLSRRFSAGSPLLHLLQVSVKTQQKVKNAFVAVNGRKAITAENKSLRFNYPPGAHIPNS